MMGRIYKYVLAAVAAAAAVTGLHAQTMSAGELFPEDAGRRRMRLRTEWNVMAGATFSGWSADSGEVSFGPRAGYHAAFDMGLLLGRRCAIVPELRFTHSSVNITWQSGARQMVKSNGLDMPLMFEYRILRGRLRFDAGPSFTLMDRNRVVSGSGAADELTDVMRLRPTVTYVVGMRGVIGRRVSVGVRFNGQFNRTEQIAAADAADAGLVTYRLGGWRLSASVGYRF